MDRPKAFEEFRYLGDKRNQVVHDLDGCRRPELVEDVVAAGVGAAFGPDTLAEARNRGYRLCRHCRPGE